MKRIKGVSKIVEEVLTEYPFTRASDDALYFEVCNRMNPMCSSMKFSEVFAYIKNMDLPKYESVSRTGRKLKEERPELRPPQEVIEAKYESYKAVLDYVSN